MAVNGPRLLQRARVDGHSAVATDRLGTPRDRLAVAAQLHRCDHLVRGQRGDLAGATAEHIGEPESVATVEKLARWRQNGRYGAAVDITWCSENLLRAIAGGDRINIVL